MKIKAAFFDLDETLYPLGNHVVSLVGEKMNRYIETALSIPREEVSSFREQLYRKYGTTAKGLVVEHGVNLTDFLHYSHDVDYQQNIVPSLELRQALASLRIPKYILTNAERFHATRILKQLQILDCFDGIMDVFDTFPETKPSPEAFERVLWMTGLTSAEGCVFFDDSPMNVETAHDLGFYAVQVGKRETINRGDAQIDRIEDFPSLDIFARNH